MIPVLGIVGAGGEVRPIDDHAQGAALEEVECPPGSSAFHVVALRINGDSMHPVFRTAGSSITANESRLRPRPRTCA